MHRLSRLYTSQPLLRSLLPSLRPICTYDLTHSQLDLPSPTPPSLPKRHRPTRVTDLYNSLVYEHDTKPLPHHWRKVVAIHSDGSPVSEPYNATLRDRLECARQTCHPQAALQVFSLMETEQLVPTPRAIIMAIEACIPAERFDIAQTVLNSLEKLPKQHPVYNARLVTSAKTLVAVAYTSRNRNEEALQVMGIAKETNWAKVKLDKLVHSLQLGRDTVAWGVLVKALTKMNRGDVAVDVVHIAMKNGIGMTDTLLHLTIDALRSVGRWRDAHWLFENARQKGIVPREKTVASILLALCNHEAKKKVEADTIVQLVECVQEPSRRFLSSALLALGGYGALQKAEQVFEEIGREGHVDEHAFVWMMECYSRYLDFGIGAKREADPVTVYERVSAKADWVWSEYLERFGQDKGNHKVRKNLLTKYLSAKTRSFRTEHAVQLCEDIAGGKLEQFQVGLDHVTCVLSAIELGCDVKLLERMGVVMEQCGLKHEPRSLAYVVGTLLGDGDMNGGLHVVREEMPKLVNADVQEWQWTVLVRRLGMLVAALRDGGMGEVKDLNMFLEVAKRKKAGVVIRPL